MNVKIITTDTLLDKIDEVKKRLGVDVNDYSKAIGSICEHVLKSLELQRDYARAMECLFDLVMEYSSDNEYLNSNAIKECIQIHQSLVV